MSKGQTTSSYKNRPRLTGYEKQPDPILVDSEEKAIEDQELEMGKRIMDYKDGLLSVWSKLDQLVEEVYSVVRIRNDYADSKEWMEYQDKVAELPIDLSKAEFNHKQWTLENEVKRYYPETEINNSNHIVELVNGLNGALTDISHIMSHLDAILVTDSITTTEVDNEVPF